MTKSIIQIERERHAAIRANKAIRNQKLTFQPIYEDTDYEACNVDNWSSNCMTPAELAAFAELATACGLFG